jgi:integrase
LGEPIRFVTRVATKVRLVSLWRIHSPCTRMMATLRNNSMENSCLPALAIPAARRSCGYRRNEGVGTWSVRCADGRGKNWVKRIGEADDVDDHNGMSFWAAQAKARELRYSGPNVTRHRPPTVAEALTAYREDLQLRDAPVNNVSRTEHHLPASLAGKLVTMLTAHELRTWRNNLRRKGGARLKPASVRRTCAMLKAALNLSARLDARITNAREWDQGLKSPDDSTITHRNVIVADAAIARIAAAAYGIDPAFGLWCEVVATTGCRPVQVTRLQVQDLKVDPARLLMPSSSKGRKRQIRHVPVPIPPALALSLKAASTGRDASAPLLLKSDGEPWRPGDHILLFREAAKTANLKQGEVTGAKPSGVTCYSLRHSSIVRGLVRGLPIRLVATQHDNSVIQIERNYSRFIADVSDSLIRGAMLDLSEPAAGNVVPLR